MLNNLILFNIAINYKAFMTIFYRFKDSDRELIEIEFDNKNS